jgi:hypothetical protein
MRSQRLKIDIEGIVFSTYERKPEGKKVVKCSFLKILESRYVKRASDRVRAREKPGQTGFIANHV